MAELVIIEGPEMGRAFPLGERGTIGRDVGNTVMLSDRRALPRHAELAREGDAWRLRVLADGATVQVNGDAVTQHTLVHGDMITVAGTLLLFSEDQISEPRRKPSAPDLGAADPTIQARQKGYVDASSIIMRAEQDGGADRRLATLYRVNQAITAILDLEPLLEKVLDILFNVFPAERGSIWLVDDDRRDLVPMASRSFGRAPGDGAPKISRTILREVFRSREGVLTQDAMEDQRFKAGASIMDLQMRAAMCVPLIFKDDILGVVHLDTTSRSKGFTREDLDLLCAIATQAAMVVNNATLFRRQKERSAKLKTLADGSRKVSALLSREAILRAVVQSTVNVLQCTKASIVLADGAGGRLQLTATVGMDRERLGEGMLAVGRGFCEEVIRSGRPMLVSDLETLRRERPFESDERYRSGSFLIVPIFQKLDEFSMAAARRGEEGGPAAAPGQVIGALNVTDKVSSGQFTDEDRDLLVLFASQVGVALANAELYEQATVDGLTRVYVRHFFYNRLPVEVRRARAAQRPLCLLMMDLDHFKRVNDEHGHQAGDAVLRDTGAILKGSIREGQGFVARYGGEEFAVLLPGCEPELARRIAGRIREAVEAQAFDVGSRVLQRTISIGGVALRPDEDGEALIGRADAALYRAKEGGRNRVVFEEE